MRRHPALRLATLFLATLAALGVVAAPLPASADEPVFDLTVRPLAVIGSGSVEFYYDSITDTIRVQVDGDVSGATRTAGTWTLTITGTRGGVPFALTPYTNGTALTITDHKTYVPRLNATGEFTVDWAYTGVGGYVVVHLVHQVAWTLLDPDANLTAGTGAG